MYLIQKKKLLKDMISKDLHTAEKQKARIPILQKKTMTLKTIKNLYKLIHQ